MAYVVNLWLNVINFNENLSLVTKVPQLLWGDGIMSSFVKIWCFICYKGAFGCLSIRLMLINQIHVMTHSAQDEGNFNF